MFLWVELKENVKFALTMFEFRTSGEDVEKCVFKILILQEILRIQNLHQVEHCAFSEAMHFFKSVGCVRNKHLSRTVFLLVLLFLAGNIIPSPWSCSTRFGRVAILTVDRQVRTHLGYGVEGGRRQTQAPQNLGPHPNGEQLMQLPTSSDNHH